MSLLSFLLLVSFAIFFGVVSVRPFQARSKHFWTIAIAALLAAVILYLLTHIYRESHPSIFLVLLFLIVGLGVSFSAKYLGR